MKSLPAAHRPELPRLDLGALVGRFARDAARLAAPDPIRIVAAPEPGITACASPTYVQIILENLLENSIDALRARGGPGAIAIEVAREGARAVVRVRDDGPGLDAAAAAALFRTAPQHEGARPRHRPGDRAGPRPGDARRPRPRAERAGHVPPRARRRGALVSRAVLLVEDDADARASLERTLTREGYACFVAASVEEALDAARRAPFLHVVVSDVVLGADDRGGIRLIARIREAGVSAPIILITAFAALDNVKRGLNEARRTSSKSPSAPPSSSTSSAASPPIRAPSATSSIARSTAQG